MKIAIDLQSCQSESRHHGIGRYSMAIVKEMLQQSAAKHDVWVLLNAQLNPETIPEIKLALKGLIPCAQIVSYQVPSPNDSSDVNTAREKAGEYIREYFVEALQPDMLLITSLYEGVFDHAVTSVAALASNTNVAIIHYDLIPYLDQGLYLANREIKTSYLRKTEMLKKADLFLTISAYSKQEIQQSLNVPVEKVVNISSAITDEFNGAKDIDDELIKRVLETHQLTKGYILYAPSGFDGRKNVEGLIKSYALLPVSMQRKCPLVLVGRVHPITKDRLQEQAENLGVVGDVRFTGYVTDEALIVLYQQAGVFVYPSFHEGFGLPALEAMSLGVPTIGSNRTSLIEVIGSEQAMFDPGNTEDMSQLMLKSLEDGAFRQLLLDNAAKQSKRFSWKESARVALLAMETLQGSSTKKPTAWQGLTQNKASYLQLIQCLQKLALTQGDIIQTANCLAHNEQVIAKALRWNAPLPQDPVWQVAGPFDSSYSLALLNRETAKQLSITGCDVSLYATEGPGDYKADQQYLDENQQIKALHEHSQKQQRVDVLSRNLFPPRVSDMRAPVNVLHHYAWEESAFPQDWVSDFNAHLQGISCLSTHVEKIMRDNGVSVPLVVSGCGVDHWAEVAADQAYKINAKPFRFLHVSSCFPRKGVDVLLASYGQAFCSNDPVTLVIKTFSNPHNTLKQQLEGLKSLDANYPEVLIIEDDISNEQLKSLYEQCHVMVAPSRAEGFGLPMAEAMLSNVPVITTSWGGQLDFCNEQSAWLVDYDFVRAQSHLPVFDSVWAEPRQEHLTQRLKEAYSSTSSEKAGKVKAGRALLKEKCQWSKVVLRHKDFVEGLHLDDQPEPRIAWISTWNTKCGIAAYSESLVKELPNAPILICASKSQDLLRVDGDNVKRNWDANNLSQLAPQIKAHQINVVVIQFNYFFYDYQQLIALVDELSREGIAIYIELHSTDDPGLTPERALKYLKASFNKCAAVLVHSVNDLNVLKQMGVIDNSIVFPLAVLSLPNVKEWLNKTEGEQNLPLALESKETFVIATYGFFLPHKGLLEIIQAIRLLRDKGHDVHLMMINARYPSDVSEQTIDEAKQLIIELGLDRHVTMNTDFLPEEESLSYLKYADLTVFPYQETGEGASSAARYGISAGKPVVTTPLAIFDDIKDVVHQLPGCGVADIVSGISKLIEGIVSNEAWVLTKNEKRTAWFQQHSYNKLALRLSGIIIAYLRKVSK